MPRQRGKSLKTIEWITSSVGYFTQFLGADQDIKAITGIRGVPGERILEELEKLDEQHYRPKPKQGEVRDGP